MRLTRKLFVAFAVLLLALGAAALLPRLTPEGEPAGTTAHAPVRESWAAPWQTLARLADAQGTVTDLKAAGDTTFVLLSRQWYRIAGSHVSGPFGAREAGSPGWLRMAQAIVPAGGEVVVVDGMLPDLSWWSPDGEYRRRNRASLPATSFGTAVSGAGFDANARQLLLGAMIAGGEASGRWIVARVTPSGDTAGIVYEAAARAAPSAAHDVPHFFVRPDGSALVATAMTYRLLAFGPDGARLFEAVRPDPPSAAVPDSIRRSYAARLAAAPPPMRRALEMPRSFPPVHRVAWRDDGRIVVLLAAGADRFQVEVLDRDGTPLGRLWDAPMQGLFFVAPDAVYRVTEDLDSVVIERQAINLPHAPA